MQRRPVPRRRVGACLHDAPSTGGGRVLRTSAARRSASAGSRDRLRRAPAGHGAPRGRPQPKLIRPRWRARLPMTPAGLVPAHLPLTPSGRPPVPARRRVTRPWPPSLALQALAVVRLVGRLRPHIAVSVVRVRRLGQARARGGGGGKIRRRPCRPNRCSRGPARTRPRCRTRPRRPRRSHRARARRRFRARARTSVSARPRAPFGPWAAAPASPPRAAAQAAPGAIHTVGVATSTRSNGAGCTSSGTSSRTSSAVRTPCSAAATSASSLATRSSAAWARSI